MADAPKRLFLLDGMALVYRAHFALIRSPIYTSKRVNASALYVFATTLLDLLEKQNPTHIAVVFDTPEPTARHILYPAYKATREAMPEDLSLQLPHVKRLIEAFRIPVIEQPGWEADDVIGTLAKRAEAVGGFSTYMVTPDKDFAQLVTESTRMYKPGRQGKEAEILGVEEIRTQWEVEPIQTIDVLGLWGDASDNVPGVPGIGEKTAKKLISEFGSIESLLEHTDRLKGKQRENLEKHRGQALLSKNLVTILTDAPVTTTFEEIALSPPDEAALRSLFVEFEFNSLGKRVLGDDFQAGRGFDTTQGEDGEKIAQLRTIEDFSKQYRHIRPDDTEGRAALIRELKSRPAWCFDVETTSLDEKTATLLGIGFSWEAHHGTYVEFPSGAHAAAVLDEFREVFTDPGIEKIGHNLKFDIGVLGWQGVRVSSPVFDTMLAHSLIEPEQRHKMDFLAESMLGYTPITYEAVFGGPSAEPNGQLKLFDDPPEEGAASSVPNPEEIARYCCEDADVTWQLAEKLRQQIHEAGQDHVFHEIECRLIPVLTAMEREGIRVDPFVLREIGGILQQQIGAYEKSIHEAAGGAFNVNSPKQVGEVLFDRLHLVDQPKKTKTGQYRTDEQTLSTLAATHAIVRDLLAYREAAKLKSTYVDALPDAIFSGTGRIHTTFHQLLTATGRLASNHPNLQNIPIRSEYGREIRRAFVPRNQEYLLLSVDYSQIELRVMASLSGDEAMIGAFLAGEDIHEATAARVFGVPLNEVTSTMRRTAKMVNFGIIYGISAFGLSQRLNGELSRSAAQNVIDEYLRQYPGVKRFQDDTIQQARQDGYIETLSGRRRYLRDINSRNGTIRAAAERTAINTPIQGSAADMIKIAMVKVAELLDSENYRSRMLLQIHDELVFDLHRDEKDLLIPKIEQAMIHALPLKVPVVVESGVGENWLEAH